MYQQRLNTAILVMAQTIGAQKSEQTQETERRTGPFCVKLQGWRQSTTSVQEKITVCTHKQHEKRTRATRPVADLLDEERIRAKKDPFLDALRYVRSIPL